MRAVPCSVKCVSLVVNKFHRIVKRSAGTAQAVTLQEQIVIVLVPVPAIALRRFARRQTNRVLASPNLIDWGI